MTEQDKIRVLLVGHSWMVGVAGGNRQAIRRSVKNLGIQVDVGAKVGSTIAWALNELNKKVNDLGKKGPSNYDAIVIFTGRNDLGRSAKEIAEDMVAIYNAAKKGKGRGIKVFIFSLPPLKAKAETVLKIDQVNSVLRMRIPKEDLIDVEQAASQDPKKILQNATRDWARLHPTPEGYQWLRELLSARISVWRGSGIIKRSPEKIIMADAKTIPSDPVERAGFAITALKRYYNAGSLDAKAVFLQAVVLKSLPKEEVPIFVKEYVRLRTADGDLARIWKEIQEPTMRTKNRNPLWPEFLDYIKKKRAAVWPRPLNIREIPKLLDAVLPAPKKLKDGGFVLLTPNDPAIVRLAKNKDAFERLYLSLPRNRDYFTTELFKRFIGMMASKKVLEGDKEKKEKPFEFYIISLKWPKLFPGEAKESLAELAGAERLAALRVILFGYISAGNEKFKEEVQGFEIYKKAQEAIEAAKKLNDSKWVKENPADAEKAKATIASFFAIPLDADTVLAVAAYMRKLAAEKSGKVVGNLDFSKEALKISTVKISKVASDKKIVGIGGELAALATSAKPSDILKSYKDLAGKLNSADFATMEKLAVQRVFNHLKNDDIFKIFLSREGRYNTTVGAGNFRFMTDEVHKDYNGLAVESIIQFLNWRAGKGSRQLTNLEWDIQALNLELKRPLSTKLEVRKDGFQDAITGAAIYLWRKAIVEAKKEVKGGAWAESLHPETTVPQKRLIR